MVSLLAFFERLVITFRVIMIAKTFIFTHIIFILTFIERYFSWLCKK